jgi:1,4-alpha-glucan branching enzyme
MVSRPTYLGGLGFGMKWDMGWMHDTLAYFKQDPIYRRYHHQKVTFRMMYAFSENYVLALSHDEVVHMKGSLLNKMAGDEWQQRANLRLLLGYQWAQSGKKLLFMGGEFGQRREWNHDASLDWHLLQHTEHRGILTWVAALNALYRDVTAMHELDTEQAGFEWVDCNDALQSVVAFLRQGRDRTDPVLVACNFTPVPRPDYRFGVPSEGAWEVVLNSDDVRFGGSGWGPPPQLAAEAVPHHGRPYSVCLSLPPLAILFLRVRPAESDHGVESVDPENLPQPS